MPYGVPPSRLVVSFILIVQEQQTSQCTYSVILRRVRVTIVAVEKICITLSECVFESNTQSASFLLCVI